MSHSACTHQCRVDSRLLVVGGQIASLTPSLSFTHNLCCKCPNGSCEVIFDIYASRPFQRYKEHIKARCFDPCNRALNFWESLRTPKSPFRECAYHPHTPSKWGCDIFHHINMNGNLGIYVVTSSQEKNMSLTFSNKDFVLLTTKSCMQVAISQLTMFDQWAFGKFFTSRKCNILFMLL